MDGRLYRWGGAAGLLIGAGDVAIMALYAPMGAPPQGAAARLAYMAAHPTAWWWILGLSVVTDILFLPLFLALQQWLSAPLPKNGRERVPVRALPRTADR